MGCWWSRGVGGGAGAVKCAMEVGASTLGDDVRVKLTFGCAIGAITLGTEGRVKLTLLGVGFTLRDLGGLEGLSVGKRQYMGMGAV